MLLHQEQGVVENSWGNRWNYNVIGNCFGQATAMKVVLCVRGRALRVSLAFGIRRRGVLLYGVGIV